MAIDDKAKPSGSAGPRTRRAVLGAAAGAVGASVIGAVALPRGVMAGSNNGQPILVGSQFHDVQLLTILERTDNTGGGVFSAKTDGSGTALHGVSTSGTGVYGQSTTFFGVWGYNAAQVGVRAETQTGIGLQGLATSGIAVNASAGGDGFALRSSGRIRADEVSGVASIPAGATSVTVSPSVNVTSESFVLLTPKVKLGGRDLWFTTDAVADTFRIRISSSRTSATLVAWLLLG